MDWHSEDDAPSVEQIRRDVEDGLLCVECGYEFVEPHGRVVACTFCWPRLTLKERQVVSKATHEERNRAAHAERARQPRAQNARKIG